MRVICDSKMLEKVKGRMWKMMVGPAPMYKMKAVVVTKMQEDKMQMA